jgi:hypothetical protein
MDNISKGGKMTKTLFILLLSLMLATITYANDLKVIGGLNLSRFSGPVFFEDIWKYRTGFEAGIGYEIPFGSHLTLEIDGMFIQKGSKREHRENGLYYYTIHSVLNEISFPVLLKLRLKTGSSPYILAGGEISFIVSSNAKVGKNDPEIYVIPPETKSFYPGLLFGCGFGWAMGRVSPFIEARYHLGLVNIIEYGSSPEKPRAIVLLLGLNYR